MSVSYADPLAFALIYLSTHLQDETRGNHISFSPVHIEWVNRAKSWIDGKPRRDAYIAPRAMGKSTWWFLILPMWAAAFGHVKYAAAFADTAQQAQTHLQTFRQELDQNEQLREDFPDLVNPLKRNGRAVADNEWKYKANSGFIFVGKGADSSSLGLKDGNRRPDLLILDDIEPPGDQYSKGLKEKRLEAIRDAILYLNTSARVVFSGTVTMTDSIIHDLVKSVTDEPERWIAEMKPPIHVHHHLPIIEHEDGSESSIWPDGPDKFSLDYMQSIRANADFAKNYLNSPMGSDGDYWAPGDFKYGEVPGVGPRLLSIDPAVTSKASSDYTGIAVIGWAKEAKRAVVDECWQVKLPPDKLAARIIQICDMYPVAKVLVETNQGGDVWKKILEDVPVPVVTVHQSDRKEVRAARVYTLYNKGLVYHSKRLPKVEEQMTSFPKAPNDDMVDAVCSGIAYLVNGIKAKNRSNHRQPMGSHSYL